MATISERLRAEPDHVHRMATDTATMDEAADTIDALVAALEPFGKSYWAKAVDERGWTSGGGRERICDWFGPSDFRKASVALALTNPKEPSNGDD